MDKICHICQQPGDLVQSCPKCTTVQVHLACFTSMQCDTCNGHLTLARRKRFNTEKFIEDCVKKLDKLCRIVIVLLSLIIIFYGAFGKSNLNPDVDRKEISLLMLCIQLFIICPSIYSCQFIESAKIPIITTIPVILFLGVMSIHIIGYLFMNEGCDFFTHRTFAIGCGVILACVTIGFVCYKVMNWCKSFIDFYSETEIVLEYAK